LTLIIAYAIPEVYVFPSFVGDSEIVLLALEHYINNKVALEPFSGVPASKFEAFKTQIRTKLSA